MKRYIDRIDLRHVLFISMIVVVIRATLHAIPPADLWWYMALGRYITSTLTFPCQNIFSYTAPHYPMIDHEWIPELVFLRLYLAGGFPWLYVFKSLMILGAFLVMYGLARLKGVRSELCSLAVMISVSFAKGSLYFDIRPYIFTYLLLALHLIILEYSAQKRRAAVLVLLPLLCWLWVNSHGAFILSFALMALSIGAELISNIACIIRRKPVEWRSLLPLGAACLSSILLSFINPYGLKLLLYPFSFFGPSFFKANLLEWQPPDLLGADWPFLLFFLLFALSMLLCYRKLRIFDGLAFLLFAYLALTTVRQITIFCIFAVPVIAMFLEYLHTTLASRIERMKPLVTLFSFKGGWMHGTGILALLFSLTFMSYRTFSSIDYGNLSMEKTLFPFYGMEFIRANNVPQPLFNPYEWGGYMLWRLYPEYHVFIDGRANTSYPPEVYRESLVVMFGEKGWQEILERYGIKSVLCNKYLMEKGRQYRLGQLLRSDKRWCLIYEDRVELLFVRLCRENDELLRKKEEGKLVIPRSPYQLREEGIELLQAKKPIEAMSKLEEALALDGSYVQLYVDIGYACLVTRDFQKGKKILAEGLKKDDALFLAHDLLGRMYVEEGQLEKAKNEFLNALKINPEFNYSREALQKLHEVKNQ
jgi:hypothetical protein